MPAREFLARERPAAPDPGRQQHALPRPLAAGLHAALHGRPQEPAADPVLRRSSARRARACARRRSSWSLLAIGFAMLLAHQLLGLGAALLAGALLAVDPSLLFVSRHDWGSFALALLFRCAGLYLLRDGLEPALARARASPRGSASGSASTTRSTSPCRSRRPRSRSLLVAPRAVADGAAHAARGGCCRSRPASLLGAAPMLRELGTALRVTQGAAGHGVGRRRVAREARRAALHARRLVLRPPDARGRQLRAHVRRRGRGRRPLPRDLRRSRSSSWPVGSRCSARRGAWEPAAAFVLATALLASLGILATPRAIRIHHVLGAYPFPQLVVAARDPEARGLPGARRARRAAAALRGAAGARRERARRAFAPSTRSSVRHGKGRWSDAISRSRARARGGAGGGGGEPRLGLPGPAALPRPRARAARADLEARAQEPARRAPGASQGDDRTCATCSGIGTSPSSRSGRPSSTRCASSIRSGSRSAATLDREGDPAFVSVRIAGPHRIVYRGAHAARPFEVILQ